MTVLLVALGAAIGAPIRFLAGQRWDSTWPLGTFIVNVLGSFSLGVCSGWSLEGGSMALLGVGFCGGLTTYSAFAVHTTDLVANPTTRLGGFGYAVGTILVSVLACWMGFSLT